MIAADHVAVNCRELPPAPVRAAPGTALATVHHGRPGQDCSQGCVPTPEYLCRGPRCAGGVSLVLDMVIVSLRLVYPDLIRTHTGARVIADDNGIVSAPVKRFDAGVATLQAGVKNLAAHLIHQAPSD
jgi:hypothetical protein